VFIVGLVASGIHSVMRIMADFRSTMSWWKRCLLGPLSLFILSSLLVVGVCKWTINYLSEWMCLYVWN